MNFFEPHHSTRGIDPKLCTTTKVHSGLIINGKGPLSEPTTAAQASRRERLLMPDCVEKVGVQPISTEPV